MMKDIKSISFKYRQKVVFFLICCAIIVVAKSSFAGERGPFLNSPHAKFTGSAKVEVKGNLVTADIGDADIPEVLNEIEKGTGTKITTGPALTDKKVTTKFEDKDVEDALREILRGYYYVLLYKNDPNDKKKKKLIEVEAKGDAMGSKTLKGKLITFDIPYGSGKGEVKAEKAPETPGLGPQSFAVDDTGNIYICDTWNYRIQVFSSSGTYLYTIPLREEDTFPLQQDIFVRDIVIDEQGFIYILDDANRIHQLDKKGKIITSIIVDSSLRLVLPLHYANKFIYSAYCPAPRCSYFVIARILLNHLLVGPSEEDNAQPGHEQEQSTLTLSGRKYEARGFVKGYNSQLDIIEKDGLTSKMLSLPTEEGRIPGDLGKEDAKGNLYFTRAYEKDKYQLWYIDKFDADANYIGTITIPSGNQNEFWAVKEFELGKNGNIYKFIPGEKNLTIHIFLSEQN